MTAGTKVVDSVCAFLIAVGLVIPILMLYGVVLSDLWLWFVTPLCGIILGKAHACGIMYLVHFCIMDMTIRRGSAGLKTHTGNVIALNIARATYALVVWGFGAILVSLM